MKQNTGKLKRTCLVKERDMMTDVWGEEDKPRQRQEVLKPEDWHPSDI